MNTRYGASRSEMPTILNRCEAARKNGNPGLDDARILQIGYKLALLYHLHNDVLLNQADSPTPRCAKNASTSSAASRARSSAAVASGCFEDRHEELHGYRHWMQSAGHQPRRGRTASPADDDSKPGPDPDHQAGRHGTASAARCHPGQVGRFTRGKAVFRRGGRTHQQPVC
jgi:hypothetical protein